MTQTTPLPIIEIKPTRGWGALGLRDVWEYRELLYFLLWREVKGRYRQMAFGPLWIILASFVVLVLMMLVYRVPVTWAVLTLPAFLLLAAITALGIGLWLAGLAVKFHDVAIGLGFAIDIWKYLTPVVYSATLVPANGRRSTGSIR